MATIKKLVLEHARHAADLHRIAGALIPGYDTTLHSADEFHSFYRDEVLLKDELWGVFAGPRLQGFIALLPGWIDHLYVDPALHRTGVGSLLVGFAQELQAELRLYTFQSNLNARAFYERHGFVVEDLTDGERNEEKMPDMTYRWVRPAQ
jgi:GNAT superfamily N-acetyltransferase